MSVRVRFAPSPTGPLHIGGLRTALYNYLFAKKNNGKFILRIEDTDAERYVKGAEEHIIKSLEWVGIKIDEGPTIGGPFAPYRQSERKHIYQQFIKILIEKGYAYYAFDTIEELKEIHKRFEKEGKTFQYDAFTRSYMKNSLTLSEKEVTKLLNSNISYVIRFKVTPNRTLNLNDIIRGQITFNTNIIDDKVLIKSDGLPTYHFANVVDDYLMKITHVIRGEEWLPSYPFHYLLYEAFGWLEKMPEFAHLPLILKPEGKGKLSKRDAEVHGFPIYPCMWETESGEKFIGFKEWGFLPEAFINMLALLGWTPKSNKEILSLQEMINEFSLEDINKAGARFDPEKAKWFNKQHVLKKENKELINALKDFNPGYPFNEEYINKVLNITKDRFSLLSEFFVINKFFFERPSFSNIDKVNDIVEIKKLEILDKLLKNLENICWQKNEIEKFVKKFCETNNLKIGDVMATLRLAITGEKKGPNLYEILECLGYKEVKDRFTLFFEIIKKEKDFA